METYLQHLASYSASYAMLAIILVAFFESLALVGLLLPGTVMMAFLGTLIGDGQIGFFSAWLAAVSGALAGDWLSYLIGRRFKKSLYRSSLVQRYSRLLNRAEGALVRHGFLTVFLGRLIGPLRPIVPLVAGMLELAPYRFFVPNLLGCLIWPVIYFLPGIMAGVMVTLPDHQKSGVFNGWLFLSALLVWLAGWLLWQSFCRLRSVAHPLPWLLKPTSFYLITIAVILATAGCLLVLTHQPLFTVYSQQLLLIFTR